MRSHLIGSFICFYLFHLKWVISEDILLYAESVDNALKVEIGTINYDRLAGAANFSRTDAPFLLDEYCIGTNIEPCYVCGMLSDDILKERLVRLHLAPDKSVDYISLGPKDTKDVKIIPNTKAPSPIFEVRETADTEKTPLDVNSKQKSWIQQNWIYVVPPLLILFFLLPEEEAK